MASTAGRLLLQLFNEQLFNEAVVNEASVNKLLDLLMTSSGRL